nr:DUF1778 domain-containing protein [uncultured Halomonas sp.]
MSVAPTSNDITEPRERDSARLNFRTTERIKEAIERAAALKGQYAGFRTRCGIRAAMATIQAHEVTRLTPEDHQPFGLRSKKRHSALRNLKRE